MKIKIDQKPKLLVYNQDLSLTPPLRPNSRSATGDRIDPPGVLVYVTTAGRSYAKYTGQTVATAFAVGCSTRSWTTSPATNSSRRTKTNDQQPTRSFGVGRRYRN